MPEYPEDVVAEHGFPLPEAQPPESGLPPGGGQLAVPHYQTFSYIVNLVARAYRWRFDEALRHNRENALAMRRDCFIMDCLRARQMPTAEQRWHLEPADETSGEQKEAALALTNIIDDMPRFQKLKMSLLEALWYGRYGAQMVYEWDYSTGSRRMIPRDFVPVNGDKLIPKWGGRWGVLVHRATYKGSTEATDRGMAHFLTPEEREAWIVHEHEPDDADFWEGELAGGIHGVGIRSRIYWNWWLRNEVMSWLLEFLERLGTGLTIFFYEAGNPRSEEEVRRIAEQQSRNHYMLFPRPIGMEKAGAGVERVEVKASGATMLVDLVTNYFDRQIRSFILGQTLSSQAQSTGLGSEVAKFHMLTLHRILKYDAINLQETLTRDLVGVLQKYNYPNLPPRCIKFVFDLDHPFPKDALDAAMHFQQMGGDLDEDEVRSWMGLARPKPGAPILEGHQFVVTATPPEAPDAGEPGKPKPATEGRSSRGKKAKLYRLDQGIVIPDESVARDIVLLSARYGLNGQQQAELFAGYQEAQNERSSG